MTEFDDWMTKMGIKPFNVVTASDAEVDKYLEDLMAELKEGQMFPRSPCPKCGLERHGGILATRMRNCFYCKEFGCNLCIGVHVMNVHKQRTRVYHAALAYAQQHPEVFNADKHCKECGKDGKTLFFESKKIDPETGLCNDCAFAESLK